MSLDDLAALLHVTERSVRRYLRELALVTELESVETRPGGAHLWRIKPSERGRAVALRRTQAYGLLAPRRIFDVMKGSALYDELDLVMRQVLVVAQRPTARKQTAEADARLEDRFLYVPSAPHVYSARAEELDDLYQAVSELRVLRFRYRHSTGERARVVAHPYAMVIHKGAVWCLAFEPAADAIRPFIFDRMEGAQAGDEHFTLPDDFDLASFLHGEFGLAARAQPTRVLVEFEPRAAEEVRARRFHPTQKIATAPDGRVRLSMTVPDVEPVKAWVLGFGAAARVIEPAELATDIVRELRRSLTRYGTPSR